MLRGRLNQALKDAMDAQDEMRITTLRLILAALKDRDIAAREEGVPGGVDDRTIEDMIQSMVAQRREAIALYEQGGRLEEAQQEAAEIAFIEQFLPPPLSEREQVAAVEAVISELDATGVRDLGRLMAALRTRYPGRMNFARACTLLRQRLA